MKQFLIYFLLSFSSLTLAQKPVLRDALPEAAGMSSTRLKRLDALFQRYVAEKRLPGVAAIVVRDGKVVYHKAFGMRDIEANDPLRRDDIFRIASMSKAITATAAMMLFEEGKFGLDDPLAKYIPAFDQPQVFVDYNSETGVWNSVPAKGAITIRQLFTHTSGIAYGPLTSEDYNQMFGKAGVYPLFTTDSITLQENIARLATLPLVHEPGEKWTYGLNSDVLGRLVEIWSGMSLDSFFRTRIFEPLGMKDTYFYLPDSKKARLVPVYTEAGTPKSLQKLPLQAGYDPEYPVKGAKQLYSGGAGLSSTMLDYAIFLQMILNGGVYNGKRLLGRKTVELMTANQNGIKGTWNPNDRYTLAFSLVTEETLGQAPGSAGKIGWGGYFSTHYFADPKERLSIVLMKQLAGENQSWDMFPLFEAIVYGAIAD